MEVSGDTPRCILISIDGFGDGKGDDPFEEA